MMFIFPIVPLWAIFSEKMLICVDILEGMKSKWNEKIIDLKILIIFGRKF